MKYIIIIILFYCNIIAQSFEDTVTFSLSYYYFENKVRTDPPVPGTDIYDDMIRIKDSTARDTITIIFTPEFFGDNYNKTTGRTIRKSGHIFEGYITSDDKTNMELHGPSETWKGLVINIWGEFQDNPISSWCNKIFSNSTKINSWDSVRVGFTSKFSQYIYWGGVNSRIYNRGDVHYLAEGLLTVEEIKKYDRNLHSEFVQAYNDSVHAYRDSIRVSDSLAIIAIEDSIRVVDSIAVADSISAYQDSVIAYEDSVRTVDSLAVTIVILSSSKDEEFGSNAFYDLLGRRKRVATMENLTYAKKRRFQ